MEGEGSTKGKKDGGDEVRGGVLRLPFVEGRKEKEGKEGGRDEGREGEGRDEEVRRRILKPPFVECVTSVWTVLDGDRMSYFSPAVHARTDEMSIPSPHSNGGVLGSSEHHVERFHWFNTDRKIRRH